MLRQRHGQYVDNSSLETNQQENGNVEHLERQIPPSTQTVRFRNTPSASNLDQLSEDSHPEKGSSIKLEKKLLTQITTKPSQVALLDT